MEPYRDSLDHLLHELSRLDLLLKRELAIVRDSAPQGQADDLRGLVITESEMDALAGQADYLGERWRREERLAPALRMLEDRHAVLQEEIHQRVAASFDAGIPLALPRVARRFGLSAREVDLFLIVVAPEIELRYETLYAYLQDDITRKRPNVNLALNLVSRSERDRAAARRLLEPDGPLVSNHLVTLHEETHDRRPSFLRRFLRADDAVIGALLDRPPGVLTSGRTRVPPPVDLELEVDDLSQRRLENLAAYVEAVGRGLAAVRLNARSTSVLLAAADWLGSRLRRPLLVADQSSLAQDADAPARLLRDARLYDAITVVIAPPAAVEDPARKTADADDRLWGAVQRHDDIVLLLGNASAFQQMPEHVSLWRVDVRPPAFDGRFRAWAGALGAAAPPEDVGRLADAFRFGRAQVDHTVRLAGGLARLREPSAGQPSLPDVFEAGRLLTAPRLGRLAARIEPRYTWGDIVLPADRLDQLRRLTAWMRHRHRVHEQWGFGRKLSRGRGLNVLFTGPSGTGKTMAAEVLAGELSLDLYQIDLSSVVSKYIGETEKNLSAIFDEADESQAILFFDEADALFGKRTEVKDAHDRYANIEINFLLQRVEQYEGVVILASNMQKNVDEAFIRRLHDVVEFPFPDEALRSRMWRTHLPPEAWIDPDVDLDFVARHFKLTGGSIRNIVLDAAFRAAADDGPIGMMHLLLATKAELQKQGKIPTKTDFGPFYDRIQPTPQRGPAVGR